jgi:tetratricopeptide (TPR) repeat protein
MNSREGRPAARDSETGSDSSIAFATALCKAGQDHMQAGRHLDAQLCCQKALEAAPDHIEALHLMGLLALQAKQYDHAIEWIARVNQQDIRTDHLLGLGIALEQQGLHEVAFKAYDRAVQLRPDDAELWANRGNALASLARPEDALASYRRVLELQPRQADAAFRCGLLSLALKRPAEALTYFNLSDELFPNHAMVFEQRAVALLELKRIEEALTDNYRAHALNPASADVRNNIGVCLQRLRRDEEALPWFDQAIALRPASIPILINKASSLIQVRRLDEAMAIYHQVHAIEPENADAIWNASLLCLLTGDFEGGWAGREVRWRGHMRPAAYPHFSPPIWRGEQDVRGKTVLLYADEGVGDTIQFARYAPMLAERGAQVILAVQETLVPLLSGLPGVSLCLPRSASPLPAFDLHCPICTLPLAFGTRLDTIPSAVPYLHPPAQVRVQAWEKRLADRFGPRRRMRVGLAWSGNANNSNDHNRSMPSAALLRLLDADADFISLQKDLRAEDGPLLEQSGIVDLTGELGDFGETAALMACLDLVISVDTSIAHLAGALGRPSWTLLAHMADWRWLLDRQDSPWYPSMRLFRQTQTRDWSELVDRVRRALSVQLLSFRPQ